MEKSKVLIVDDDPALVEVVKEILGESGLNVVSSNNASAGFDNAAAIQPDLIVLDVHLGQDSGFEVCRKIKADPKLRYVPVIMLTGRDMMKDELEGFRSGADDYITKPFKPHVLLARIISAIERSRRDLDANSLTRLPGNRRIIEELQKRIDVKAPFSVIYLDINNFKSFNDRYGFVRGDQAIKLTAEVIGRCLGDYKGGDTFLGHVGGDDFVAIVDSHDVGGLCARIGNEFNAAVPALYDEEDRRRRKIVAQDRKGNQVELPFIGLAIAVVTNQKKQFQHPGEIAYIAGDLKRWAKTQESPNFVIDRRV